MRSAPNPEAPRDDASADTDWRTAPWAARTHRVEVDGGDVAYVDLPGPPGPPIVLIHGLGGQWRHWLANLDPLSRTRRVVALDLPGFGASDPIGAPATVECYASVVEGFCERLGLDKVVLVGHSFGGCVAVELTAGHPARVERLALVSTAGLAVSDAHRRAAMCALRTLTVVGAALGPRYPRLFSRRLLRHLLLARVVRHPANLRSDLVYCSLLAAPTPALPEAMRATVRYLGEAFEQRLRVVQCPVLVIWGDGDALVPAEHAARFPRLAPGARVVTLRDTGHLGMLERPEEFNRLLAGFAVS